VELLNVTNSKVRLFASWSQILDCPKKNLAITNALAYFATLTVPKKSFIKLSPDGVTSL